MRHLLLTKSPIKYQQYKHQSMHKEMFIVHLARIIFTLLFGNIQVSCLVLFLCGMLFSWSMLVETRGRSGTEISGVSDTYMYSKSLAKSQCQSTKVQPHECCHQQAAQKTMWSIAVGRKTLCQYSPRFTLEGWKD